MRKQKSKKEVKWAQVDLGKVYLYLQVETRVEN